MYAVKIGNIFICNCQIRQKELRRRAVRGGIFECSDTVHVNFFVLVKAKAKFLNVSKSIAIMLSLDTIKVVVDISISYNTL